MQRVKTYTEKQEELAAAQKAKDVALHDAKRHEARQPHHPTQGALQDEADYSVMRAHMHEDLAKYHREQAEMHERDAAFDLLRWHILLVAVEAERPQGEIDLLELANCIGSAHHAALEAGRHPNTCGIAAEEADQAQRSQ